MAGKTGTAELNLSGLNQPWFIGFTSDVAVAVTLERVQGGTGGTVAAPVAKAVLESLGSAPVSGIARDTLIDGRYRVVNRIGSGGMADVYCADDTQLGRKVALKLLHPRFAEDDEFVERFRREASSAAGLQHPNVVAVFDRGEWDGTYYIAMEYLAGPLAQAARPRPRRARPGAGRLARRADPQGGRASPTAAGSCTATSSRTT